MAIELDPAAIREEAAVLMGFRLRARGFASGAGGRRETDFTSETTPTAAQAERVTTRQANLTADDFPGADTSDAPELRTIAALRSAIELELSVDNFDRDRIAEWRTQLREYVGRVGSGDGDSPADDARALEAVYGFGPRARPRAEGSECSIDPGRTRRAW